jgi:Spy/CpxP family protein refolding chaperone
MKSRIVSMAAGALVLAAAVATAQQQTQKQPAQAVPQPAGHSKAGVAGQGRGPKAVAKFLELTPAQETAWKKIQTETAAAVKPLRDRMTETQKQLDEASQSPTPDSATIGKLTLAVRDTQTQIHLLHEQGREKFSALLTADQKAKYDAFEAAGKANRAAHPQH